MEKQSVFERLSAVNVNEFIEKKKDLSYLPWAIAWRETKKVCPDATYKVYDTYHDETLGYMCHTTVTIEGETLEMWLPVMDGANKSMMSKPYTYQGYEWQGGKKTKVEKTVEAATSFDINKTIMRCLVKNLAMFGLGISLYVKDDGDDDRTPTKGAPKVPAKPKPKAAELAELKKGTEDWEKVIDYVKNNKTLGLEKIGSQLNRRYKISAALKKEIANLIKAE